MASFCKNILVVFPHIARIIIFVRFNIFKFKDYGRTRVKGPGQEPAGKPVEEYHVHYGCRGGGAGRRTGLYMV